MKKRPFLREFWDEPDTPSWHSSGPLGSKSKVTSQVEKSSTSKAFHAHATWFYGRLQTFCLSSCSQAVALSIMPAVHCSALQTASILRMNPALGSAHKYKTCTYNNTHPDSSWPAMLVSYYTVPMWLLQVAVPLWVLWGYSAATARTLASGTVTCSSHSGTA